LQQQCKQWKDNEQVFGCNEKDIKPKLKSLCDNPRIISGSNYPPDIYVFRGEKYWKFDNEPKPNKPFGELVEGEVPAKTKWPSIHFPGGAGYQKLNFIMIYKTQWSRWRPNKNSKSDGEDSDGDYPDDRISDWDTPRKNSGGKGNKLYNNDNRDNPDGDDSGIENLNDTNSNGVEPSKGKPSNNQNNSNTNRSDDDNQSETDFKGKIPTNNYTNEDNTSDSDDSETTKSHIKGVKSIKSGGKPSKGKLDGNEFSGDKLSNSDINDIKDEQIREEEVPDEPDGDGVDMGALVSHDDNVGAKTEIKGDKVCNLLIKNNKAYFTGKCISIDEDKNNFPPNIVAAIKLKDKNWYFINREGKYCKRKDETYKKVN